MESLTEIAEEISLKGGVISLNSPRYAGKGSYNYCDCGDCSSDNCDCTGGDCYCTDCNECGNDYNQI